MTVIGFTFGKNDLRYGVLDLSLEVPTLKDKNKLVYPKMDVPELMQWFETQLILLIDKHKPMEIAYKISMNLSTLDQIKYSCYPQAILNLIARKKDIRINCYSGQAINATKFGLPVKTDIFELVDDLLGTHPPYWDRATKEAVLVAWFSKLR